MRTIEELKQENSNLSKQLDIDSAPLDILNKMRENEAEIKQLKRIQAVNEVNRKHERLRADAMLLWECEQPTQDITCVDGTLHSTKVKKYPKLAALHHIRAKFQDGLITEITYGGRSFYMYEAKYEYNKPTVYTRPDSFAQFCKMNSILPEPLTIEQYNAACKELDAAKETLKEHVKKYEAELHRIGAYNLSSLGLIGQRNENIYTYTPNQ